MDFSPMNAQMKMPVTNTASKAIDVSRTHLDTGTGIPNVEIPAVGKAWLRPNFNHDGKSHVLHHYSKRSEQREAVHAEVEVPSVRLHLLHRL